MFATGGKFMWAVAVVAVLTGTAAAQDVKLRYQFKEGDKPTYTMEQKMTMEMMIGAQAIKTTMNQVMDFNWDIKSVDKDGKAQMTQTITRVKLTVDGPQGKAEFDSKDNKEPTDPIGKLLAPALKTLVGAEIAMTMDPRGQPTDIKLSDKFKEALKNNPAAQGPQAEMLSEDGIKKMMTQSGLILPEGAVKMGANWTNKAEMKLGALGKMNINTQYNYDGPETKDGKTLQKITLKPDVTLEADPNAPVKTSIKSQDSKGKALFDNKEGRLVETNLTQELVMEINAMGQMLSQKTTTTTALKLQGK
jgi:hypothetical protein